MASEQSKWLATAAGTVIVLSGALLKSELDKASVGVGLTESGIRCGSVAVSAILISLVSLILGSVVQGSVLRYMEGDKRVDLISCSCDGKNHLFGKSIGDHLWQQRWLIYIAIFVIVAGFVMRIFMP